MVSAYAATAAREGLTPAGQAVAISIAGAGEMLRRRHLDKARGAEVCWIAGLCYQNQESSPRRTLPLTLVLTEGFRFAVGRWLAVEGVGNSFYANKRDDGESRGSNCLGCLSSCLRNHMHNVYMRVSYAASQATRH